MNAGSQCVELAFFLHPVSSRRRMVLVLSVYFDESGTHANPEVFSLGGYVFTQRRLRRFEPEWLAVLKKFKVAAFHASDLESGVDEFAGWPADRRSQFLRELAEVINRHALLGVGVIVNDRAFASFGSRIPQTVGRPFWEVAARNAYGLCLMKCLEFVAKDQFDRQSDEKIACICDNRTFQGTVKDLIEQAKAHVPWGSLISAVAFASDTEIVPLQAADLLAYMLRKGGIDIFNNRPNSLRDGYRRLRPNLHRTAILDERSAAELNRLLDDLLAKPVSAD